MAKNPKRAVKALTACGERVDEVEVREITLGLAAVLELLGSPLVVKRGAESGELTLREMLPTIFAMTRSAAETERLLAEGGFEAVMDAAVAWADDLSTATGMKLAKACARMAVKVADVSPQGDMEGGAEGNADVAETAG